MRQTSLSQYLDRWALESPDSVAVEEPNAGSITYAELVELSNRVRHRLAREGVGQGDRVGILMRKSIDAVASIFGILKAGAAYVPLDPASPGQRNAFIVKDCVLKMMIAERRLWAPMAAEAGHEQQILPVVLLDRTGSGAGLKAALEIEGASALTSSSEPTEAGQEDLAYILYTSGSTGSPKGVMLSHENATSFVAWCSDTFDLTSGDRFSSHAPFHFDLSIFDLFVSTKRGATLVLIDGQLGRNPLELAHFIAEKRISIWYSTPSILNALVNYGRLERYDYSALRLILFAGEPFPLRRFRALKALIPMPRYYNLYGPTETNVCTYYEVPREIPPSQEDSFPIGMPCSHVEVQVRASSGNLAEKGEEGELWVTGPSVMKGYWNSGRETEQAFAVDGEDRVWYRTGDRVVERDDGSYVFRGRRDRLVKRRGYRIELGEIEACVYRHPAVVEAGASVTTDHEDQVRIVVFLVCRTGHRPTIVELKQFCMEHLPHYMIPDRFLFSNALPKTSTGKIDYQQLKEMG